MSAPALAIAGAVGVDTKQVQRDLSTVDMSTVPDRVVGLDGKSRPAHIDKRPRAERAADIRRLAAEGYVARQIAIDRTSVIDDEGSPWCAAGRLACETWDIRGPHGRVLDLAGLSERQAITFVLHRLRGLSLRAIARLVGHHVSTIAQHFEVADNKLRRPRAILTQWAAFNRLVLPADPVEELRAIDELMRVPPDGHLWARTARGGKRPVELDAKSAVVSGLAGRGYVEDLSRKSQHLVGIDPTSPRRSGPARDRASAWDERLPDAPSEGEGDTRHSS